MLYQHLGKALTAAVEPLPEKRGDRVSQPGTSSTVRPPQWSLSPKGEERALAGRGL